LECADQRGKRLGYKAPSLRDHPALKLHPQFRSGAKAALLVTPGVVSWGMISGVAMVSAGLSPLAAMVMSVAVFAGASQLAALQLIGAGAALPVVILAGFVINLRFMLFSLSLAPHVRRDSPAQRAWYSYLLTDNGYALSVARFINHPGEAGKGQYLLGTCLTIWLAWQAATLFGVMLGSGIPARWSLEFTIVLTFIALVTPHIKDRASVIAAITAAAAALATAGLPFRLGLIVSATAAIAAGMLAEKWMR
jgi:4-azaleucine resistance transporter AzlC